MAILGKGLFGKILLIGVAPLLWTILRGTRLLFNIRRVTWHHRRFFATVTGKGAPLQSDLESD
jgi:hypothetical protein